MKYEDTIYRYRIPLFLILVGLLVALTSITFIFYKKDNDEILITNEEPQSSEIIVEISGAVKTPGVYNLQTGSRIEDLIQMAGGFTEENKEYVSKALNRAAILKDGQKIYIPAQDDQSFGGSASNLEGSGGFVYGSTTEVGGSVNINSASKDQLDELPGIGPVYAQNIIDHRPYSDINELVSKGALKQSVYDKIKNNLSVY